GWGEQGKDGEDDRRAEKGKAGHGGLLRMRNRHMSYLPGQTFDNILMNSEASTGHTRMPAPPKTQTVPGPSLRATSCVRGVISTWVTRLLATEMTLAS